MKNRQIALSFIAIVASVAIVFSACKKLNESTELGGDLVPAVDNITTFDTLITVEAYNDTFGILTDSQYLGKSEEYFLGKINTDPYFGATDARMFFELKPPDFKYYYGSTNPDSLAIDSVVLVLGYIETYGDSNTAQNINVYEMDQSNNFTSDSSYLVRKNNFTYSNLLGSRSVVPKTLDDSVKAYKDTTSGQLRIRLNNSFGTRLLSYDSISTSLNGAYSSDSAFRAKFKGFAVQSMGPGNAIMGFDLTSANTKLAVYYRYRKNKPDFLDTTVAYFIFKNFTTGGSAAANYVKRDYTGTPVLTSINNGPAPDPLVYIQTNPGTFATIKIPALTGMSNRVVHRAELVMEELYDISDSTYTPPSQLYLDASDPSITLPYKYRTIPYDLVFTSSGSLDLTTFGSYPVVTDDGLGNKVRVWKFNISRYAQHIFNGTQSLYTMRLFAPFSVNEQYGIPPGLDVTATIFVNPAIAKGRVRLIGNTGVSDTNPRRMRLRIVYSKL